ncbi:MAG: hypothetical protein ABT08_09440 [Microbacterium sp. SCN 71-21]|uniref:glycosyltransferase family 9 protein n=2 Tax=unclassified Microbacterium TaxID=2609290 RepID=UPI00086F7A94|nr:glycosyltransferase family 9 protein [Microbacterium sp. SCN 71-21]ODU76435.1 MAG: hypothetical protein ABT08_09440 [Microbacterium sp. SCN 71-21]
MTTPNLFRKLEWQINAIRHRDPLSPRLYWRLFGSLRRRPWGPTRTPRRIVVMRSDEIGDTVTTTTLLAAMRAQWPKASIHLVVKPGPATIFHAAPTVDRVIPWSPVLHGSALKRQVLTARQALRRFRLRGYDLAVLPRWDFDDTPLRYLAVASRARSVVGFAPVPSREPAWLGDQELLLTDVIDRGDVPLLSVQQLERVAAHLGVRWTDEATRRAGTALYDVSDRDRAAEAAALRQPPGRVVGFGIGARDGKRQWPIERLNDLAAALAATGPLSVQVLGGAVDVERAAALTELLSAQGIPVADLAGALSLSESAAAISRCDLFVGNDSGLQHIASSLDVPTVVVTCHPATGSPWSDNAPERFGPWSTRCRVVQPAAPTGDCGEECVASHAHCILAVETHDVLRAVEEVSRELAG